tara:strand:- start:412 stop:1065 length:654 start_codon:yes stop_codon:yes gene_type:complete
LIVAQVQRLRGGAETSSLADAVAQSMGLVMSAMSISIFAPILIQLALTQDPSGFSTMTWACNLAGFALVPIGPIRRGYPFSSYCEYSILIAKSLAINAMIYTYGGFCSPFVAACACATAIGGYLATIKYLPERFVGWTQGLAAAILTLAPLPQIAANFLSHSGGGWPAASAAIATVGNVIRVFTTMRLAEGDKTLLAQFTLGTMLNGIMWGQILLWD